MSKSFFVFFVCFSFVFGCSTASPTPADNTPACVRDHPRPDGVPTASELVVQKNCTDDGGMNCDAASFISQAAAECLAKQAGLSLGIVAWRSRLVYNYKDKLVRWIVESTIYEKSESGASGGDSVLFNATTGEQMGPVSSPGWAIIP